MGRTSRGFALCWAAVITLGHAAHVRIRPERSNPYSQVQAEIKGEGDTVVRWRSRRSRKYLVASFPSLQQVAYVQLPDNVWRPLVVGELRNPGAVAVDTQKSRLFVADSPNSVIWWYQLRDRPDGFLETTGRRTAAVEGYAAYWMDVTSNGDLFFSGHPAGATGATDSVFRQEAINVELGTGFRPTEVFSRANTGSPSAQAWKPSGITTDSFYVYWGNEAEGLTHGTVVRGSRDTIGANAKDVSVSTLNNALDGALGVVATGTHLFWLSSSGVFGTPKNSDIKVSDANTGFISPPPESDRGDDWDPHSIAWDGDNTLYLTDSSAGIIYSLPALNIREHNLTKFTDAPGISDLAIIGFQSYRSAAPACGLGLSVAILASLAVASLLH